MDCFKESLLHDSCLNTYYCLTYLLTHLLMYLVTNLLSFTSRPKIHTKYDRLPRQTIYHSVQDLWIQKRNLSGTQIIKLFIKSILMIYGSGYRNTETNGFDL